MIALKRPLSRQLSNQQFPNNLVLLKEPVKNAPGWLKQRFNAGQATYSFQPDAQLIDDIRHVLDWIVASLASGEKWMRRCDKQGRPFKLLKLGTLKQALAEANDAMSISCAMSGMLDDMVGHLESVMAFPDGAHVLRLLTPQALDAESAALGHCVGHGAYDQALKSGDHHFFSLRTASGKGCATMEVDVRQGRGILLQCKGKKNKPPVAKYLKYIQEFLKEQQFELKETPAMTGLIEQDGMYYDVNNLPDNFHYRAGMLDLRDTNIQALPKGLTVDGSLCLARTPIQSLPDNLTVGGNLDASYTNLETLPRNLKVQMGIAIGGTRIRELPSGLFVPWSLYIENTPISRLPNDLFVGLNINISGTQITEIPHGVRGWIITDNPTRFTHHYTVAPRYVA